LIDSSTSPTLDPTTSSKQQKMDKKVGISQENTNKIKKSYSKPKHSNKGSISIVFMLENSKLDTKQVENNS
jgi:hypothetical protein